MSSPRSVAALVAAVVLVGAGCSYDEVPTAASPSGCGRGPAEPLNAAQVAQALKRHGVSAEPSPNKSCTPSYLPEAVSNIPEEGEGIDENEVFEAEGLVDCVFFSDQGGPPSSVAAEVTANRLVVSKQSEQVEYFLANANCAFYFYEGQRDQVQRVTDAMRELERSLR